MFDDVNGSLSSLNDRVDMLPARRLNPMGSSKLNSSLSRTASLFNVDDSDMGKKNISLNSISNDTLSNTSVENMLSSSTPLGKLKKVSGITASTPSLFTKQGSYAYRDIDIKKQEYITKHEKSYIEECRRRKADRETELLRERRLKEAAQKLAERRIESHKNSDHSQDAKQKQRKKMLLELHQKEKKKKDELESSLKLITDFGADDFNELLAAYVALGPKVGVHDGLNLSQFTKALNFHLDGGRFGTEVMRRVYSIASSNSNGNVTFHTTCAFVWSLVEGTRDVQIRFAFDVLDLDGDGNFSRTDMRNFLKSNWNSVKSEQPGLTFDMKLFEITELFSACDTSEKGSLTFEEIKKAVDVDSSFLEMLGFAPRRLLTKFDNNSKAKTTSSSGISELSPHYNHTPKQMLAQQIRKMKRITCEPQAFDDLIDSCFVEAAKQNVTPPKTLSDDELDKAGIRRVFKLVLVYLLQKPSKNQFDEFFATLVPDSEKFVSMKRAELEPVFRDILLNGVKEMEANFRVLNRRPSQITMSLKRSSVANLHASTKIAEDF